MKFYYNGQLMRTSKNHEYTHAILNENGKCEGCRTSKEACQSYINTEINRCKQEIENDKRCIRALNEGKSGYYYKDGRKTWFSKFEKGNKWHTIEFRQENIEYLLKRIEILENNYKIIELEQR